VVLSVLAFVVNLRPRPPVPARAPNPWAVGALSLVGSTLLMVLNIWTLGRNLTREGPLSGWVTVAAWIALVVALCALIAHWSRREGWGALHRLALAGGAVLTYAWIAFPQVPVVGSTGTIDLIGNMVFAAGAVTLLAIAVGRINRVARRGHGRPGQQRG
jgi:cytochrome bd-type quinol oxidase subunit 2